MKVALVHDYIGEFGGAERVLLALAEIWPEAPIYTAFTREGTFLNKLAGRKIITSWAQNIPFFASHLHSPLRFLTPLIWGSFNRDLAGYDVVITSASWFVTKGVLAHSVQRTAHSGIEICYCHTPPRYLYGYETSVKPNWLIRAYSIIVNPFMRYYDFVSAQKVDYFIANSKNVAERIKKFYRRDATVIYPPVQLTAHSSQRTVEKENYYLVVARLVGAKGIEMAIEAAEREGFELKIVGEGVGYSKARDRVRERENVEFLGFVSDQELAQLYAQAKAFLALARDEDFGITPVEAMQAGTPVIAYHGGGYLETVIADKTGVFFKDYSVQGLISAIKKLEKLTISPKECKKQGAKFSKERFKREINKFVADAIKDFVERVMKK